MASGIRGQTAFQFTPLREGRPWFPICWYSCRTFQFTPLREGRPKSSKRIVCFRLFQFTPLREGRLPIVPLYANDKKQFQFTPLREGRPAPLFASRRCSNFNSRPSARGDTDCITYASAVKYFNSRPSARGDGSACNVSRHRPQISIHAPPRGATRTSSPAASPVPYFNSRPSARGDSTAGAVGSPPAISIHAPPRGATG